MGGAGRDARVPGHDVAPSDPHCCGRREARGHGGDAPTPARGGRRPFHRRGPGAGSRGVGGGGSWARGCNLHDHFCDCPPLRPPSSWCLGPGVSGASKGHPPDAHRGLSPEGSPMAGTPVSFQGPVSPVGLLPSRSTLTRALRAGPGAQGSQGRCPHSGFKGQAGASLEIQPHRALSGKEVGCAQRRVGALPPASGREPLSPVGSAFA